MKVGITALALAGLALVLAIASLILIPGPATPPAAADPDSAAALEDLTQRINALEKSFKGASARIAGAQERIDELDAAVIEAHARADRAARAAAGVRPRVVIRPGVKIHDKFETNTGIWQIFRITEQVVGTVSHVTDQGRAKVGRGALALKYVLAENTFPLLVRMASRINRLSLWIRTLNQPAEVYIGAHERDDSNYGTLIHIEPGEGWKHLELDLSEFVLDEDSIDENGRLDFDQIDGISIVDVGGFMGTRGENTLLVDEVIGEYRPGEDAAEVF